MCLLRAMCVMCTMSTCRYVCEPCHFHRRERPLEEGGMRYFGPRTFNLPNNIDTDKIQASLEGGVLVIVMPKLERDAPTTKVKIVTVAEAPEVPGMDTDVGRSSKWPRRFLSLTIDQYMQRQSTIDSRSCEGVLIASPAT